MSYDDWCVPAGFDASQGLLTPREVADLYRVDIHTAQRWARTGRLAAMRLPGRDWRFSRRQVYTELGVTFDGEPATP